MQTRIGRTLSGRSRRERWLAFTLIAPALIVFLLFMFWPLAYTVYLSFFKWNMVSPNMVAVGIDNYIAVLKDPVTWQIMRNTVIYLVVLVVFSFLLPYVMAFINQFLMQKARGWYKTLLFVPSMISLVVGAIVFQWIFNPLTGPVGNLAQMFGWTLPSWSKTADLVIFVISLVAVYKAFGYNFLILLSGVSSVPEELIEAAKLEKTPKRTIFSKIVVPLTSSSAIYILIMCMVQGIQYVFTPIKVLTQGGPNNASSNVIYRAYETAFTYYETGISSVISVLTLVLFMVLLYLEFRYVEQEVYYEN
ncbi:MAG: sugar ABC transporter permease [Veillonellaceae bacterium]|nr:sugar ABC transporter permease [Veillonellaceae bacterium]